MKSVPKTGLAVRMRAWMKALSPTAAFTSGDICLGLNLPPGQERDRCRNALGDFVGRGEIIDVTDKQYRRQTTFAGMRRHPRNARIYQYQPARAIQDRQSDMRQKIFKAMRLKSFREPFTVADIRFMMMGAGSAAVPSRSYIDKLARRLLQAGYLRREGARPRASRIGTEALYRVANTDKFRLEVMK